MKRVIFFTESKNGMYMQVEPNYVEGKFCSTYDPPSLSPCYKYCLFSFPKTIQAEVIRDEQTDDESMAKNKLATFKNLVQLVLAKTEEDNPGNVVAYVLIYPTKDARLSNYWWLEVEFQYLFPSRNK